MTATNINITTEGNTLYLTAPYNPTANADYKGLGARWDGARKSWKFSAADLNPLREVLHDHFGYDDRPIETVTVRVALHGEYDRGDGDLEMFNRTLASRETRDARVKLAPGVRVVEGSFEGSAGSMRHPALGDLDGIVLEVRDVPAAHADLNDEDVTIQEAEELPDTELAALEAERATLIARLAEIDARLAQK